MYCSDACVKTCHMNASGDYIYTNSFKTLKGNASILYIFRHYGGADFRDVHDSFLIPTRVEMHVRRMMRSRTLIVYPY